MVMLEVAMATLIQERSKITAKGQTTVPKAVRKALGVSSGDEIAFIVDDRGVSVRRVEVDETDPVIEGFLRFLARDMERDPRNITPFPPSLAERLATLAQGIDVEPNAEIDGPVAL